MVKVSTRSLHEVDLIYYMTDVTRPFGSGERYIIEYLQEVSVPAFLLVNKIDLVDVEQANHHVRGFLGYMNFAEIIFLSAMRGTNIPALLEKTWSYLPEGPLYYPEGDLTDQPLSFMAAELIREKALWLTRDEIPHSLAVDVEELRRPNGGKAYLRAVIYLERDSQKGIVIGKNGRAEADRGQSPGAGGLLDARYTWTCGSSQKELARQLEQPQPTGLQGLEYIKEGVIYDRGLSGQHQSETGQQGSGHCNPLSKPQVLHGCCLRHPYRLPLLGKSPAAR